MNLENQPCTRAPREWGLDPLFWTSAKLFVGDLHAALPSSSASVFFVGNQHIVRGVEVVGIVVSVDTRSPKMTLYNVDDGTGVVLCVQFVAAEDQPSPALRQAYELGTTVRVEGRLTTFRGVRQVVIRTSTPVAPDQEALGWLERLALR
ncbi:hypothetical protein IWW55_003330, partial [Coemansia sp. RSA 2706]